MEFEGLEIEGPDDVVRHYEEGANPRPRDEHPTDWMLRLAAHDQTRHDWVDEALRRLIVDRGGAELEPSPELGALINTVSLIQGRKLLPLLRARLVGGIEGWSDARAASFLQWLIGARAVHAEEPLDEDELDRIEELGARPGGFSAAGSILGQGAPWRLAGFARANLAAAVDRDERAIPRLAFEWVTVPFAPYRLELLRAVAEAREALTGELRQAIEGELRTRPPFELGEVFEAAWVQPEQQNRVFGRMVARAYGEGDVSLRRALLVHPRDGSGLGQPASFDEYAAAVQVRAERDDAPLRRMSGRITGVGEPEPMPDGKTDQIEMAWVPIELKTEDGETSEDRLLIYRLGDRFKVGLALERRGKASEKKKS
jgi:hypothetical protein